MRRISLVSCALLVAASFVALPGCEGDSKVSDIKQSEAATKADEAGRKAIEDMMKNKSAKKGAAAPTSSAPAGPAAPK